MRRAVIARAAVLMAAAAVFAGACGGSSEPAGGNAAPGADTGRAAAGSEAGSSAGALSGDAPLAGYNLLLITLDTLRADHLGAYGYEGVETPNIDRLGAEGVRFERVTTTVPVTLPAHASIMTGLNPFAHGVRNNGSFVLRDDAVTLAEVLRDRGYATGGFIGAVVLEAQFGIAQGFDDFNGMAQYQARTGDLSGERPGEDVVARASEWIRGRRSPFFAWAHMYDPHDPYAPPEPYAGRYADNPYDGEVAYVDEMVGRLLQELADIGAADNTLVVVTADHGEGLGDHGEGGHSFFVYDSTVRVPLIFWAPGVVPAGVVPAGGTSVADIFPTVLSLLGVAPSARQGGGSGADGIDLSPRFHDPDAEGTAAYAESLLPYLDFGWSELRALVSGGYKYIAAPEPELYNLAEDPGEADNLVDVEVARADAMEEELAALVGGDDVTAATGVAVDADSVAALQALGYLAGGGPGRDRRDIDPKDMVVTYETFVAGLVDATDAIADGRYGDANETLVRLDELVPDQYVVYYYFGQLAFEAGDPETSVDVLEHALELNPSYLPTYTQLAASLHAAGDVAAALDLIAQAQAMFPNNFSLTLQRGAIAHDTGDLDGALAAYLLAERLDPDHPELLERMGHLHLLRQQPRDAVVVLRRLVEVTPTSAPAWAQLAFGLAQTGQGQEAQSALARALELDPADPVVQQIAQQLR
jgi:arylsulfatase A-like enzyme/Flp pilus assembly protein TadD